MALLAHIRFVLPVLPAGHNFISTLLISVSISETPSMCVDGVTIDYAVQSEPRIKLQKEQKA